MPRGNNSGIGLLIGAVLLFAALSIVLYFGTATIGSIDSDIAGVNFSNETEHVYNATKTATATTFTMAANMLPLVIVMFIAMLLLMVMDKIRR